MSRLIFILSTLMFTLSCSVPIDNNGVHYTIHMYGLDDKCRIDRIHSYILPNLPNVVNLDSDYEVVDKLIDHIQTLRQDLTAFTEGCSK